MKKDVLEISQNSQENTCTRVIFLNKVACLQACKFIKKETLAQVCNFIKKETAEVLSCEFCEIFKNTFFTENLWRTASIIIWILTGIYIVIVSINAANIRLHEDVLKTSFVFVFRRRLQKTAARRLDQDRYIHLTHTSSEDVFKTSSRRLDQDQYIRFGHTSSRRLAKTYSKRLQDVFKTSCKNAFKTSSRNLGKTF